MNLSDTSWKKFLVSEIFDILNGSGLTKDEVSEHPGNVPAVQSGEENSGILGYINLDYAVKVGYTYTTSRCLTVARSGTAGSVHYFPHGCVIGDSAKILLAKDNISEKWLRTSGITAGIPVAAPLHHMDERLMHPEDRGTRWRRVMQAD